MKQTSADTNISETCGRQLPAMDDVDLARLAKIFQLLGDPKRLQLVLACLHEAQPVCCLAEISGMSQPLTSHHLRALREARVLKSTRKGKQVYYALDDHHIQHVILDMANHVRE
uniref:ArsR/SmtB family transcription factor n=1 Tax=Thaumasiovibrio occultus TaxID=1891184 RepID=UPI00192CF2A6|nr:metalloregulator ArsR/SmtB family transcription factor [Thaumasiovibrio occultus]